MNEMMQALFLYESLEARCASLEPEAGAAMKTVIAMTRRELTYGADSEQTTVTKR
jgi:hypothetical protein